MVGGRTVRLNVFALAGNVSEERGRSSAPICTPAMLKNASGWKFAQTSSELPLKTVAVEGRTPNEPTPPK